ncbi:sugar kinase [Paenibacillus sp. NPDC057967]|uniref:sugar kinase n=1 Tax=Paenibacillus sp. NPDC057967 TaxID=3346293 RepID=UPI0036DB3081
MTDVVTIGESMVLFQPFQGESVRYAPLFTKTIAGAESNVAIGLTRLGHKARWIGRVGNDPFGDLIVSTLGGEGVDISFVIKDLIAPTAVFFKEYRGIGADPSIYYYRKGSAASGLSPKDVRKEWFEGARHLHVTGITPALGSSAFEAIRYAMQLAREMGLMISYDPNLRRKLWSEEEARSKLTALIPYCDYFLPGIDEAEFLLGKQDLDELGNEFLSMGPKVVVIKLGAEGSIAYTPYGTVAVEGVPVSQVIDTVGAGDAFAVGFLSTLLKERNHGDLIAPHLEHLTQMLRTANELGSLAVQFRGDWEGMPTCEEVQRLQSGTVEVTR